MSKVDVLFINPRDLSVPIPYIKNTTLAAVLLENGYQCEIIEPAAESKSLNAILDYIKTKNPLIVCVSIFPSTLPDGYKTISAIKSNFPSISIVVEGYMINADKNVVLQTNADFGVFGDCEYTFLELTNYLYKKCDLDLKAIDGLVINQNGSLVVNKPAFIKDLNNLPVPAFHLLPIGRYYTASSNKCFMIMYTDRGCPYDCNFCANPTQKRYRFLSTDNVIKHIKVLVEDLGVEYLEFMDLTFTINKRRTIDICRGILSANLKFEWACETRADLLDLELLEIMKLAGCYKITIGVESGNAAIRYSTGKKIDDQTFLKIFDLCKQVGIKTMANFIFGHKEETVSSIFDTIYFSLKLNPYNVLYTKMIPLPDVDLFFDLVKQGEVNLTLWYQYMKEEVSFPVYYPKSVGFFKMELLYRLAYVIFYFRLSSIFKYSKMFSSPRFAYLSIGVVLRFIFGKTIYK
jgi:anaerobic magnesium-protoporphyrin IX monomethyl ester cyclase